MHMSVYLDGHLVMCVYERESSRVSEGGRESDASLQYVAPDGGAVCFSEVLGVWLCTRLIFYSCGVDRSAQRLIQSLERSFYNTHTLTHAQKEDCTAG